MPGYEKRSVAYLIDDIILSVAGFLVILFIGGPFGLSILSVFSGDAESAMVLIIAVASAIMRAIFALTIIEGFTLH